jgi:MFS superfamily sulfate permease-like transporter
MSQPTAQPAERTVGAVINSNTTAEKPAWIRFDRHELAGAFGDIGTDLPLIVALIASCQLDATSVCICFGVLQMAMGLLYGIPMPVQPLKAMAAIMLARHLSPGTLGGAGIVIGATMLLLAVSGTLTWLARITEKHVVRGLQLGLGLSLGWLAVRKYITADAGPGLALALISTAVLLLLRGQKKVPAPLIVIALGVLYGVLVKHPELRWSRDVGLTPMHLQIPTRQQLAEGALLLALPQIPLSLGNSVIATSQATEDLFAHRAVSVKKIGITYGLINLVAPLFGGIPVCHGCGGLVGFYGFGARTGGAPILYGALYVVLGLFFGRSFSKVIQVFPLPVLGVVLLFEAAALVLLLRDITQQPRALVIALLVAIAVLVAPYGYVVGLLGGIVLTQLWGHTTALKHRK